MPAKDIVRVIQYISCEVYPVALSSCVTSTVNVCVSDRSSEEDDACGEEVV